MNGFSAMVSLLLVLVVVAMVSPAAASLACSAQWQCSSVSQDYNYVACVNGQCQCLNSNGFVGSANASDHCRCEAPRSVYWTGGSPYCISYPLCASSEVANDRSTRLKAKAALVYQNLVYPTATAIISGQHSVTNLFAPNTRGRVDPVGHFDSFATLTEYYYGLANTPTNRVTRVDITDLIGSGNEVYIRVNIFFEYWDGVTPPFNLTESGRFIFDDNDLISSADLIIHNLGKSGNPPASLQPLYIEGLCATLVQTCPPATDPNGYYDDFNDCMGFLSAQVPFGTFDQASSNTVVCRFIHALLTPYDPLTHCPHAGKTGGGKCIDTPYSDYYLSTY